MRRAMLILLLLAAPLIMAAQDDTPVALCTEWVATVDDSQHIVLRWSPSPDPRATGYIISTGDTLRTYATVNGRTDTTLVCRNHSALERHVYGLIVFTNDEEYSAMTPKFGNMVLNAEIPRCETTVNASWSAYIGMPSGIGRYSLMGLIEPYDDDYMELYATDSAGTMAYNFALPEGATRVHLKVRTVSKDRHLVSYSNTVSVERGTVDSAAFVKIDTVVADSLHSLVLVQMPIDTAFREGRYTLWRSLDGSPWNPIVTFNTGSPTYTYIDRDIMPFRDSLHCYQLSVVDGCGMNPRYSAARCTVVPEPPEPACYIPNAVVAGDADNGIFLPVVIGPMGDLYELTIYNRQGMQVFHTTDPEAGWRPDASTPQGAYTYSLHVRYIDNRIKTHTGTVMVLK